MISDKYLPKSFFLSLVVLRVKHEVTTTVDTFVTSCGPLNLQSTLMPCSRARSQKASSEHDFRSSVLIFCATTLFIISFCICHQYSSSQMSISDPYLFSCTPPFNPPSLQLDKDARLDEWPSVWLHATILFSVFLGNLCQKPILNHVIPLSPSVTVVPPLFLSVSY